MEEESKAVEPTQVIRQDSLGQNRLEINVEEANKIQLKLHEDEDTPKFGEDQLNQ
jgi:hypothetical protein